MAADWRKVREEFPALKQWTFLNTATFGQLPRCAVQAVTQHFHHRDELACADFLNWFDDADRVRGLVARLIRCTPDDIAFVPHASAGLTLFLEGIDWRDGDRVVVLEGEFPNNLYGPQARRLDFVEVPWDRFYETVSHGTRAVLMSTANYSTGFRPPLEDVGRFLRERGVLWYLDGTQSMGAIEFDVQSIQPDVLSVHGYKWLLCPTGAGFVYVSPSVRPWLKPTVVGWRSDKGWRNVNELNHGAPEFKESAEKYEGAMLDFPAVYAMGATLEFLLQIGTAEIERRVMGLSDIAARILEQHGGQVLYPRSHILAARFDNLQTSELAARLKQERILVSSRHGNLRVSVHLYNNENDLEILDRALGEIR